jgi:hypothetical protein
MAEIGCSRERKARLALVLSVSWWRRQGKSGSVRKPGRAVVARRRWQMNRYFHISTVFRVRREALRNYFVLKRGSEFDDFQTRN